MGTFRDLGKIILGTEPMQFGEVIPNCPAYDSKMIFMDKEKQKEWEELDSEVKTSIMKHLHETTEQMEVRVAIRMLCHCINDLNKRLNENTKENL